MIFKNFINDEEWHKWRSEGVGGSDVPIIMSLSPYKKRGELLMEKLGVVKYTNKIPKFILEKAEKHEQLAREKVGDEFDTILNSICVEKDKENFYRASLDGWSGERKIILEHKFEYDNTNTFTLLCLPHTS